MWWVDTRIYNAGSGAWGAIDEVTPADFEAAWRTNAFGLFLTARAVIPGMTARSTGTIQTDKRERIFRGQGKSWPVSLLPGIGHVPLTLDSRGTRAAVRAVMATP